MKSFNNDEITQAPWDTTCSGQPRPSLFLVLVLGFYRDCPRLSVDIDLHYLPDHHRAEALADILNNMQAIKSGIEVALPGVNVIINERTTHATVQYNNVLIKIEPNTVIRGTLLPAVEMPLCFSLAAEFNREMHIRCVAKDEL